MVLVGRTALSVDIRYKGFNFPLQWLVWHKECQNTLLRTFYDIELDQGHMLVSGSMVDTSGSALHHRLEAVLIDTGKMRRSSLDPTFLLA